MPFFTFQFGLHLCSTLTYVNVNPKVYCKMLYIDLTHLCTTKTQISFGEVTFYLCNHVMCSVVCCSVTKIPNLQFSYKFTALHDDKALLLSMYWLFGLGFML